MRKTWDKLNRAERRQVEQHRRCLSERRGHDVDLYFALDDWLSNHAMKYRGRRHAAMLELQRAEIERHKWLRSEELHRDIGKGVALDWIRDYAAGWREWFEEEYADHEPWEDNGEL